jgi:hypothetical protein
MLTTTTTTTTSSRTDHDKKNAGGLHHGRTMMTDSMLQPRRAQQYDQPNLLFPTLLPFAALCTLLVVSYRSVGLFVFHSRRDSRVQNTTLVWILPSCLHRLSMRAPSGCCGGTSTGACRPRRCVKPARGFRVSARSSTAIVWTRSPLCTGTILLVEYILSSFRNRTKTQPVVIGPSSSTYRCRCRCRW